MAELKRDRVNRVTGLVHLPMDGSSLVRGQTVTLTDVKEKEIDCQIRDAMEMEEPIDGNSIGDAVFDAMSSVQSVPEVIGDDSQSEVTVVLGFGSGNFVFLLDTGGSTYSGGGTDNMCDANDVNGEG